MARVGNRMSVVLKWRFNFAARQYNIRPPAALRFSSQAAANRRAECEIAKRENSPNARTFGAPLYNFGVA